MGNISTTTFRGVSYMDCGSFDGTWGVPMFMKYFGGIIERCFIFTIAVAQISGGEI